MLVLIFIPIITHYYSCMILYDVTQLPDTKTNSTCMSSFPELLTVETGGGGGGAGIAPPFPSKNSDSQIILGILDNNVWH